MSAMYEVSVLIELGMGTQSSETDEPSVASERGLGSTTQAAGAPRHYMLNSKKEQRELYEYFV